MSQHFQIIYKNEFIGTSALEFGDPPMGVAFGPLTFSASEKDFGKMLKSFGAEPLHGGLQIDSDKNLKILEQDGTRVQAEGCYVWYGPHIGEAEAGVLGVPSESYRRLFPELYASYYGPEGQENSYQSL